MFAGNRIDLPESEAIRAERGPAKYPRAFTADSENSPARESTRCSRRKPRNVSERFPHLRQCRWSERSAGRALTAGTFSRVTTVVLKLLEIVRPHFAYFGRKDAQQVLLISQMARDLNLDTEIVVCPIVREPDGLALSSRNIYLTAEERRASTVLHRALIAARDEISTVDRDALQLHATVALHTPRNVARVDYACCDFIARRDQRSM